MPSIHELRDPEEETTLEVLLESEVDYTDQSAPARPQGETALNGIGIQTPASLGWG